MKKTLFSIIIFLSALPGYSQSHSVIDSLKTLLKNDSYDTNRVIRLNKLSSLYMNVGNYDTASSLSNEALSLSKKLDYKKGIAISLNENGAIYYNQSKYTQARDCYSQSLDIFQSLNDKKGTATSLIGIGNIYNALSEYSKALDYYFQSLKIQEQLNDTRGISSLLNNIGTVYQDLGEYQKTIEYQSRAMKISIELNDKSAIATSYGNIGLAYQSLGNYEKSLDYQLKSLDLEQTLNDKQGIAGSLGNIGLVYYYLGDYEKSLDYFLNGLAIQQELNDEQGMAASMDNIGGVYLQMKKYSLAISYSEKAQVIAKKIGNLYSEQDCENTIYQAYKTIGDNSKALEHYEKYIVLRDSIFKSDNQKQIIRNEMNYEFDKKNSTLKAEQDKKDVIASAEKTRQTELLVFVVIGLLAVIIFSGFIFKSLRITRKQKNIIERQKALVEEHQKDIVDSITYAKRLQQAILPPVTSIENLFSESFVLYKPKDIVAGDFYWMEQRFGYTFIAACDCTGHGVPGAMLSVVCSNALNRAVNEFEILDTGTILDKVTELVLETFLKNGEDIKDGMDISICAITPKKEIYWSGANNPLWYISNSKMNHISPDKQPIGQHDNRKPFSTHKVDLKDGDSIFLFTDGYADQFGGEKGKKYKYKKLEEKLLSINNKKMSDQKLILENDFSDWMGNLDQVDDVTIIGIRL